MTFRDKPEFHDWATYYTLLYVFDTIPTSWPLHFQQLFALKECQSSAKPIYFDILPALKKKIQLAAWNWIIQLKKMK